MAFSKVIVVALVIVAAVATPALAANIIVGDDNGWKLNFDYQAWAQGKEFHVGDNLIFNYKQGAHNVIKVDGPSFQQCSKPENSVPLTSGNDAITLAGPGKKWYICGFEGHCESGMKLVINVVGKDGSTEHESSPNSSAGSELVPRFLAWMIAAFVVLAMTMF